MTCISQNSTCPAIMALQILQAPLRFSRAEILGLLVPPSRYLDVGHKGAITEVQFFEFDRIIGRA
jgi:hypothetical protein